MIFEELVEKHKDNIIDSLVALIRFPSVEADAVGDRPFGKNVNDALQYALDLSEKLGLKVENFDNYAGHAEYGEGEETLGVLVHLDVVPAGDEWDYPPFAGEIHNGRIYGRGAVDNKGAAIAALYAIKAIMDSKLNINKTIRVIFGTNEETGWQGINYYLQKNPQPDRSIVPDDIFPMIYAEKGILHISLSKRITADSPEILSFSGGEAINTVPNSCEIVLQLNEDNKKRIIGKLERAEGKYDGKIGWSLKNNTLTITSTGTAAHGSMPEKGLNAITQQICLLASILDHDTEFGAWIANLSEKLGMDYHGNLLGIAREDQKSGPLTISPGTINDQDGVITMEIDIRYPVTVKSDSIIGTIQAFAEDQGMRLSIIDEMLPNLTPLDSQFARTLLKVYQDVSGDHTSKPGTTGGGTYARAVDNAVVYGGLFPDAEDRVHEKNEFISIDDLMKMTVIFAEALYALSK